MASWNPTFWPNVLTQSGPQYSESTILAPEEVWKQC